MQNHRSEEERACGVGRKGGGRKKQRGMEGMFQGFKWKLCF